MYALLIFFVHWTKLLTSRDRFADKRVGWGRVVHCMWSHVICAEAHLCRVQANEPPSDAAGMPHRTDHTGTVKCINEICYLIGQFKTWNGMPSHTTCSQYTCQLCTWFQCLLHHIGSYIPCLQYGRAKYLPSTFEEYGYHEDSFTTSPSRSFPDLLESLHCHDKQHRSPRL